MDRADRRGWRLGGGVFYSALAAASLGIRAGAVMGVDEQAAGAFELEDLRALGVQLHLVTLADGPVFENRETPAGRSQMVHGASDRMAADLLPVAWRRACGYLVAPVAGELGDDWAEVLPATALVALGYQGILRELVPGRPVIHRPLEPSSLVRRADLASASDEDLRAGSTSLDLVLERDHQELVVTRGEQGSVHLWRDASRFRVRRLPAVPARRVVDRTGAGDTFLAAWAIATLVLRSRSETRRPDPRALHLAALAASVVVERSGFHRAAVRERAVETRRPGGSTV